MQFVKVLKKRFNMSKVTDYEEDPDYSAFVQENLYLSVESNPLSCPADNMQVHHDKQSIDRHPFGMVNEMATREAALWRMKWRHGKLPYVHM